MLCEKCGKRPATSYVKQSLNGEVTELRLCSECCSEYMNVNPFSGISSGLLDPIGYLTNIFPAAKRPGLPEQKKCTLCGSDLATIMSSGKVGCGRCYTEFRAELMPSVAKIHGNVAHTGKLPKGAGEHISRKRRLESLQARMTQVIAEQNFEEAAKIRDEIKALSGEGAV